MKNSISMVSASNPKESVSGCHVMEKPWKREKKQCSFFPRMWKSEQPFLSNMQSSWLEMFWVVGQLWGKTTSELVSWNFFKACFLPLLTINTKVWEESKAFANSFAYWLHCWKLKKMCLVRELWNIWWKKWVCQIVTIGCWRKYDANFFNAPNG